MPKQEKKLINHHPIIFVTSRKWWDKKENMEARKTFTYNDKEYPLPPKIEVTTELNKFHRIEWNRDVLDGSVKTLAKSMKENFLLPYVPIVVSNEYGILDGQNRLEACRKENLPVYYIMIDISDEDAVGVIITLNTNQRGWRQESYLKVAAYIRGGCWAELYGFYKENLALGISNCVVIYPSIQINAAMIKRAADKERKTVTMFGRNPNCERILAFLDSDIVKRLPSKIRLGRPFVLAVRHAAERYTDKEMKKLQLNALLIQRTADYTQYLTEFENIIKPKRN